MKLGRPTIRSSAFWKQYYTLAQRRHRAKKRGDRRALAEATLQLKTLQATGKPLRLI